MTLLDHIISITISVLVISVLIAFRNQLYIDLQVTTQKQFCKQKYIKMGLYLLAVNQVEVVAYTFQFFNHLNETLKKNRIVMISPLKP